MTRRFGPPRVRAGQLKLQYGKIAGHKPDIVVAWGDGTCRADASLIMNALTAPQMTSARDSLFGYEFEPSIVEELERRGYDVTTLRFSIEMKPRPEDEPDAELAEPELAEPEEDDGPSGP